jgi:hypothetical protein
VPAIEEKVCLRVSQWEMKLSSIVERKAFIPETVISKYDMDWEGNI